MTVAALLRQKSNKLRLPKPREMVIYNRGGLDLVTPSEQVPPGRLRECQNVELDIEGGYVTSTGYERFNGKAKPSAANYSILDVTITGSLSNGDTVTGASSSATGVIVVGGIVTEGSQDYIVITKVTGTFSASENLEVSASVEANTDALAVENGASTNKLHAQYKNLAADEYRSDIAAVTGSGSILGVWALNDIVYAWRNNVGDDAAAMYKSSGSGWTAVALGRELSFTSGGTYVVAEGDTITGNTSSATAVITRVILESGTLAGGDAAGRYIFASQTGTFQSETLDVGGNVNVANIAADSSAITMSKDGRFEFVTENFGGPAGTDRIYGCDGVNRPFEFDGTVFCPIDVEPGASTLVAPKHLAVFKRHLFLSYAGSAQHSGIGTPYIWTIISGAAELGIGDEITNFEEQPSGAPTASDQGAAALAIMSRNRTHILYGSSTSDWHLQQFRKEIGAYAYTSQELGVTMTLDDRGVGTLKSANTSANFQHNSISRLVTPFVKERRSKVVASCIARDKSQYRLFFSDKSALYITMHDNKLVGCMQQLFADAVTCICSIEGTSGDEAIYFGSTDGQVYQAEKGTSHDGDNIQCVQVYHPADDKRPRTKKKYKDVSLEITGNGYAEFNFTYELSYGSTLLSQPGTVVETTSFSSSQWDSFVWDQFIWDGKTLAPSVLKVSGRGNNIAYIIKSNSDYFSPTVFSGTRTHYFDGRELRG